MSRKWGTKNGSLGMSLLIIAGAVLVSILLESPATAVSAQGANGAQVYATRCANCHQPLGEGIVGQFPALRGNPKATDPDYVTLAIREGRDGATDVVYPDAMPPVESISDEEITAVVAYVVDLGGRSNEPVTSPTPAPVLEPPDADRGKDLFTGASSFDNGGAACASCHTAGSVGNLSGPGLGPDLTSAHLQTGGDIGLGAWLASPPSRTMSPIFLDRPLTGQERADVVAFLADAPSQDRQSGPDRLLLAGLGGVAALTLGMAVAWRGMRQTYVSKLRSNR